MDGVQDESGVVGLGPSCPCYDGVDHVCTYGCVTDGTGGILQALLLQQLPCVWVGGLRLGD